MDLDTIKKTWQETKIEAKTDEEKINRMLMNVGNSAFSRLIRYEKIGLITLICCLPVSFIMKHPLIIWVYFISILFFLVWQIYKLRFLKSIDLINSDLLTVSIGINKYKKYLKKEIIAGSIWLLLFSGIYAFSIMNASAKIEFRGTIAIFTLMVSFSGCFAFIIYKLMYSGNLKVIDQCIKEAQEFQRDNQATELEE